MNKPTKRRRRPTRFEQWRQHSHAPPVVPVPSPLPTHHCIALTGYRCINCGACSEAEGTPAPCCDQQFAVRVGVLYPKSTPPAGAELAGNVAPLPTSYDDPDDDTSGETAR